MWSHYVNGIAGLLATLAHGLNGSYGAAILLLALLARLALMPLTLRQAEQGWLRQQRMARLKPDLERLRERHAGDPLALSKAMGNLYRSHGIRGGLGGGLIALLIQAPLVSGLYAAVRGHLRSAGGFLWIPRLARPDLALALLVAAMTLASSLLSPMLPEQARTLMQWLPVVVSFLMVWHLAAGLGLYWLASTTVGAGQNVLLRQRLARMADTPHRFR